MSVILLIITVLLALFSLACASIFLWLNNFPGRTLTAEDLASRNKTMIMMQLVTMALSQVTAFLAGLLSDYKNVKYAILTTVALYYVIAICMLLIVILTCASFIYRFVSKKDFPVNRSGMIRVVTIASAGLGVSIFLAWLMS